jgi:hypothetical protein
LPLTEAEELELLELEKARSGGQPAPVMAQSPNVEFAQEHPIARTIGRTGRTALSGLSSLSDLGLLVPKTAALGIGLGAEKMGSSLSKLITDPRIAQQMQQGVKNAGQSLQRLGATPTMSDTSKMIVDQATGNKLQPINGMEKGFDFAGEMIASAVPFSQSPKALSAVAGNTPPSTGTALTALLDPQTALNQLPKTAAQRTAMLPVPRVSDEGVKVAKLARQYGIPLGLDDVTDSQAYKTMISEGQTLPFSGSAKRTENQLTKFTEAVSKSVGLNGEKLTVENIDKAFTNVGKEFDTLTKGKTFTMNDDVAKGLNDVLSVAENGGYGAEGQKQFGKYMADLGAVVDKDGVVDGETLAKLRAKLNAVGRKGSDPNAKALANELESVISDFITDGNDDALRQAKYRYKNLIAIEPLAAKDQLGGQISPASLLPRVRQVYKRQFSRGDAGELGDLANIGQYIKETIPNSGTSQRTGMRELLTGNSTNAVALLAGFSNPLIPIGKAALSAGGLAANRGLQSRNFDDALMEIAMQGAQKSQPLLTNQGALAALAGTNTAGQQMLPKPQLRIQGY